MNDTPTPLPTDLSGTALEEALAQATGLVIDPAAAVGKPPSVRANGVRVVLSSRRALDPSVALGLARWATTRHRLVPPTELVATLIREAAVNATVHGNLGLPGLQGFGGDLDGYLSAMDEALACPDRATRPVLFAWRSGERLLTLHVRDGGNGFASPPPPAVGPTVSGNGLRLIRSIADRTRHSQGGRCLSVGFRCDA